MLLCPKIPRSRKNLVKNDSKIQILVRTGLWSSELKIEKLNLQMNVKRGMDEGKKLRKQY